MLQITSIKNGFMLDHIKAGMGVKIFRYLHLDELGHQVALIINADSKKIGKKDIIKIENLETINYTVLGLLSPGITINEVRNEIIISKIRPKFFPLNKIHINKVKIIINKIGIKYTIAFIIK